MGAGHRDDQDARLQREVPRRIQIDTQRITAVTAPRRLLAGTGQRVDRTRQEIDDADLVVLGVGHVEQIAIERETLRPIEPRLQKNAVVVALQAGADRLDQLAAKRRDDNPVVIGIRDVKTIASSIRQDLARVEQRPILVAMPLEILRQR